MSAGPDEADRGRTRFWRSLRAQVLAIVGTVLCAPLLVGFAWGLVERRAEDALRQQVTTAAEQAARVLEETPGERRPQELETVAANHELRIRVATDGLPVVDVDRAPTRDWLHDLSLRVFGDDRAPTPWGFDDSLGPVAMRPEVQQARRSGAPVSDCRVSAASKLLNCYVARPLPASGGVLYVDRTDRRALRPLYDLRFQLVRLVALLLPPMMLLAWWLTSRFVGPVEALRRAASAKASSSRPHGPLPQQGQGEVGELSRAFNLLIEKLDQRRRDNERFVADAAHEIKNPLATVRAAADTLESGRVDEDRALRLARVLRSASVKLDELVSQLLELARAEAGMAGEDRCEVDLVAVARGTVQTAKLRHPEVAFSVEAEPSAKVHGVLTRLESLIQNLVDNAASFAAGRVDVRVIEAEDTWIVQVRDDGPGIAPDVLPRVFDRFFTSRAGGTGTGLGLALARAIAEAHGGSLDARSTPGQGATLELRLPRRYADP